MDHKEVGELWDANADDWTKLVRLGYDVMRHQIIAPAFMAMLPEVSGLRGLDIGCGEGANTRLLAQEGEKMAGIDISSKFVRYAQEAEAEAPLGVEYRQGSAVDLPFTDGSFDFAAAFMSFMDIPEHELVISEAYRVIRPGGFLQFAIIHPCIHTSHLRWVTDESGVRVAVECGGYFTRQTGQIDEWIFSAAPPELRNALPKFRIPRFTRTLSDWLNLLLDSGFILERLDEPHADEETAVRDPRVADTRIVAMVLTVRCRKPA